MTGDDLPSGVRSAGNLPDLPDRHFIGGTWRASVNGGVMQTFDPGRAAPHAEFAAGDADDAAMAVEAAKRAGDGAWRTLLPRERGRILTRRPS